MSVIIECAASSSHGVGMRKCRLSNPEAKLEVEVVAPGGRVSSIKYGDAKKELVDFHSDVLPAIPALLAKERAKVKWEEVGLGGERTWVAPQSGFHGGVPFLDLDLGGYDLRQSESGVVLISPICKETNLQVVRRVEIAAIAKAALKVTSQVANRSKKSMTAAPWHIFQAPTPTAVVVGPLSNPPEVFSDFGDPLSVKDFAVQEGNGFWRLAFAGVKPPMFKLGFNFSGPTGTIRAFYPDGKGGIMQITETFPAGEGEYPHKGPAEIFFNPFANYVELEVLGKTQTLAPGQSSDELMVDIEMAP